MTKQRFSQIIALGNFIIIHFTVGSSTINCPQFTAEWRRNFREYSLFHLIMQKDNADISTAAKHFAIYTIRNESLLTKRSSAFSTWLGHFPRRVNYRNCPLTHYINEQLQPIRYQKQVRLWITNKHKITGDLLAYVWGMHCPTTWSYIASAERSFRPGITPQWNLSERLSPLAQLTLSLHGTLTPQPLREEKT